MHGTGRSIATERPLAPEQEQESRSDNEQHDENDNYPAFHIITHNDRQYPLFAGYCFSKFSPTVQLLGNSRTKSRSGHPTAIRLLSTCGHFVGVVKSGIVETNILRSVSKVDSISLKHFFIVTRP